MKKYSIVLSHTGNDLYTLILKSFELDKEEKEINKTELIKTNQSLENCLTIQNTFING